MSRHVVDRRPAEPPRRDRKLEDVGPQTKERIFHSEEKMLDLATQKLEGMKKVGPCEWLRRGAELRVPDTARETDRRPRPACHPGHGSKAPEAARPQVQDTPARVGANNGEESHHGAGERD